MKKKLKTLQDDFDNIEQNKKELKEEKVYKEDHQSYVTRYRY